MVCFRKILIVSPAPLAHAEQEIDQRSQRKEQVADQEILRVQDIFAPIMCRLLHTLYPSTQGRLAINTKIQFNIEAFFLLHPKLSMQLESRFSNTAMTVEKLAADMNKKNSIPHTRPPAMLANTFGRVMKISWRTGIRL